MKIKSLFLVLILSGCADLNQSVKLEQGQSVRWAPPLSAGITEMRVCTPEGVCSTLIDGKDRDQVSFSAKLGDTEVSYSVGSSIGSKGQQIYAEIIKILEENRGQNIRTIADLILGALTRFD